MVHACCVASIVPDSLRPHGLWPTRILSPWRSPGKNTRVGGHALLQGIIPTQGSNPDLLHCRWIFCHLSHQGSPFQPLPVFKYFLGEAGLVRDAQAIDRGYPSLSASSNLGGSLTGEGVLPMSTGLRQCHF